MLCLLPCFRMLETGLCALAGSKPCRVIRALLGKDVFKTVLCFTVIQKYHLKPSKMKNEKLVLTRF